MSGLSVRMTPGYPSDPDTGDVCLSAPQYPRHQVLDSPASPVVTSSVADQTNTMCQTRQSDNIGSIITMLISDQSVDLEDYLSDPVLRQQEGETELDREEMGREEMDRVLLDREQLLQADVKEETLSEAVVPTAPQYCQEFDYYNSEFIQQGPGKSRSSSRSEGDEENCQYRFQQPSPAYSTISYCKSGYSPLLDMSNYSARRVSGLATPALGSGEQRFGETEKKDEKYWERRRKNNLAAKKSRDSRRVRENQLRLRVLCLENANRVLREQMDRKEGELGHIRERLNKYESLDNCQTNYL